MTTEDVQRFITLLEEEDLKENASFGILADEEERNFIQANRKGLLLFAKQLLKAANDSAEIAAPFEFEGHWLTTGDSVIVEYIKYISPTEVTVNKNSQSTLSNKLSRAGCIVVSVLLIIALVTGIWTLLKWLF